MCSVMLFMYIYFQGNIWVLKSNVSRQTHNFVMTRLNGGQSACLGLLWEGGVCSTLTLLKWERRRASLVNHPNHPKTICVVNSVFYPLLDSLFFLCSAHLGSICVWDDDTGLRLIFNAHSSAFFLHIALFTSPFPWRRSYKRDLFLVVLWRQRLYHTSTCYSDWVDLGASSRSLNDREALLHSGSKVPRSAWLH